MHGLVEAALEWEREEALRFGADVVFEGKQIQIEIEYLRVGPEEDPRWPRMLHDLQAVVEM